MIFSANHFVFNKSHAVAADVSSGKGRLSDSLLQDFIYIFVLTFNTEEALVNDGTPRHPRASVEALRLSPPRCFAF
jgi:hypothetical protein